MATPDHLSAELETLPGEMLAVGDGAILYRDQLEAPGRSIEFASTMRAHPEAAALVELAVPRFLREEHDRLHDVVPMYLRRSDAEIAWDRRSEAPALEVTRMRRRHLRGVMAIERQVYAPPWSANLFAAEIADPATAATSWRGPTRRSSGTAG